MNERESKRRLLMIGFAAVLAAGVGVAILDPGFGGRAWLSLSEPAAEGFEATPGQEVRLVGVARHRDGCLLQGAGASATIEDDRVAGSFEAPGGAAEELLWFDVVCDGEVQERVAREVRTPMTSEPGRVDVARVYLESEALQTALSQRLPSLINPPLRNWLDQQSHGAKPMLRPGARIDVRSGRIRLDEDRLYLDLTADLDLRLAAWDGAVHVQSEGLRFASTIGLDQAGRIQVRDVALQGSLCKAYEKGSTLGWLLRPACGFLQWTLQPGIEGAIGEILTQQAAVWRQSIDRRGLVGQTIIDWAERMHISERLARRLSDADFDVRRGRSKNGSIGFTVTVDKTWLGRDPGVEELEIPDSDSPVDIGISVALVNNILGVAFDRPLSRVLPDLVALADVLDWTTQAKEAMRQIHELEDPSTVHQPGSLGAYLAAVSLQFQSEGSLVPKVVVDGEDTLRIYAYQARLARSVEPSEHVDVGFSLEGRFEVREVAGRSLFQADRPFLFNHFTMEALPRDGARLDDETRVRHAALARLVRQDLAGSGGGRGWAAFNELLGAAHELPSRFEMGSMRVDVDRVGASQAAQALVFAGGFSSRTP